MIREQAIQEAFAHFSNDLSQDCTAMCAIQNESAHNCSLVSSVVIPHPRLAQQLVA